MIIIIIIVIIKIKRFHPPRQGGLAGGESIGCTHNAMPRLRLALAYSLLVKAQGSQVDYFLVSCTIV